MDLRSTNKAKGITMAAVILDSYHRYCEIGYPADPNIYEIRVAPDTYQTLVGHIQSLEFTDVGARWPFKIEVDSRIGADEVLFGPEQVLIKWRDMNGM